MRSGTDVGDDPEVTVGHPEVVVPIELHIADFLTDLRNMNTPANTICAYRGDLTAFAEHVDGDLAAMSVDPVRAFVSEISDLAPATRKRKRAAVSAFCRWAVRHDRMPADPMDKVGTITVPKSLPRPAPAADRIGLTRDSPGSAVVALLDHSANKLVAMPLSREALEGAIMAHWLAQVPDGMQAFAAEYKRKALGPRGRSTASAKRSLPVWSEYGCRADSSGSTSRPRRRLIRSAAAR
ncbi:site-specific integrase [Nocardia sp. AB354]|uniref:site-specific integrase n=1 Tax=Nocardia sp. AB354 TaxID=3413283 RepID=UPI003C18DFA7